MIQLLAIIALTVSAAGYLWLGLRQLLQTRELRDLLPVSERGEARVAGAAEFSSSTIAATISLATVVLAFTELAPVFGPWLLWTAGTTAAGLSLMRICAPRIWRGLGSFGSERPTLHAFLGYVFRSQLLTRSAAFCTATGFLGALAVELTVGSRFLAGLVPSINGTLTASLLAAVSILYTLAGGFRVVVQTDRIQMIAIWLAIAALAGLVFLQAQPSGGLIGLIRASPAELFTFSWREGLLPFLLGIFVINVPNFLGDMSVWQRIAGTRSEDDLKGGLARSVIGAAVSWSSLAILACLVVALAPIASDLNPLAHFLGRVENHAGILVTGAVFVVITGLYAANLSTASTQLIAAVQTLQIDLTRGGRVSDAFASSQSQLLKARLLVLVLGIGSVVVVEGLRAASFSISDLVFAIYGSQLGLAPAAVLALVGDEDANSRRGSWVTSAIILGFAAGWSSAVIGKWIGDADLVFLAPVCSLIVSGALCLIALTVRRRS